MAPRRRTVAAPVRYSRSGDVRDPVFAGRIQGPHRTPLCAHAAKAQYPAASLAARSAQSWAIPLLCSKHNPVAEALVRVQHASAQTDAHCKCVRAFRLSEMNTERDFDDFGSRSVSVAPGMLSTAIAFANEISAQVKTIAGIDLKIAVPVGGNAARMAWIANYENLAQYEAISFEASWRSKISRDDQEGGGHLCTRYAP